MATPDKPAEQPEQKAKASAAKKRGKKQKVKPVKKHGRKEGDKTAREWAIEYLKAHKGRAKFGELTGWVSEKLGGNLSWVPTYYMKSPGFSRPERGIVAFNQKDYDSGKKEIAEARKQRLAAGRAKRPKKAGKKAGKAPKSKKAKPETTLERRQRTAREKAEREANDKADFDEAEERGKREIGV